MVKTVHLKVVEGRVVQWVHEEDDFTVGYWQELEYETDAEGEVMYQVAPDHG